jgi:hypothetical protein
MTQDTRDKLIERLLWDEITNDPDNPDPIRQEAATTLETDRQTIEGLREALEQIADLPGEINPSNYDHDDACELNRQFCYGATIARRALDDGGEK